VDRHRDAQENSMPIVQIFRRHRPTANQEIVALRLAAIAGVTVLLAVSAPMVWAAVSAGVGVAALMVLAAVGTLVFQSLPLAMQVLENRLLRLRKSVAAAHPIEQLQNDLMRREQRLVSFRAALATIGGQITSMAEMIEDRRHADPGHVLDRQTRALDRMVQFHAANVRRLDEAHVALEAFRQQVRQKRFEWDFAQSGEVVMAALNPSELQDLMQDLLTDSALQSVQKRFNDVFAELDLELHALEAPTRALLDAGRLDRLEMPGTSAGSRRRP
jgi:hypothetical protein